MVVLFWWSPLVLSVFDYLFLFSCLFCCPIIFIYVLLSALPLVVLTCPPPTTRPCPLVERVLVLSVCFWLFIHLSCLIWPIYIVSRYASQFCLFFQDESPILVLISVYEWGHHLLSFVQINTFLLPTPHKYQCDNIAIISNLHSLHLVPRARGCLVPSLLRGRSAPPGAASVTPGRRLSVPSPTDAPVAVLAGWWLW